MGKITERLFGGKEPDQAGDLRGKGFDDLEKIASDVQAARNARGEGGGRTKKKSVEVITQEELDSLFEQENWEPVVNLYFNTRYVMTGYENFLLKEQESARLARTCSATMRVLLKIDPAYIAIALFTINFGGTIAAREALWAGEKQSRRAKAKVAHVAPGPVKSAG